MTELEYLYFTEKEKQAINLLIIEPEVLIRRRLANNAAEIGIKKVVEIDEHGHSLKKFASQRFSHIIFSAQKTDLAPGDFLQTAINDNAGVIAIVSSRQANLDSVYELLALGARGFLLVPFSQESLSHAMVTATKTDPISESVLRSDNRNEVLIGMMAANLDKIATLLKEKDQSAKTEKELSRYMATFRQGAELAKNFHMGNIEELLGQVQDFFVEKGRGPMTKLRRVRRRLQEKREKERLARKKA